MVASPLEVHNLEFAYRGSATPALKDVQLRLRPGSLVGVVGATGAGKSTLCALFGGFVPHFYPGVLRGEVVWRGRSLARCSHRDWLQEVGVVFANPATQRTGARFTVEEEVAVALEGAGMERQALRARVDEVLEELGLTPLALRAPATLSGGQQQRVALACALVSRPALLVADEPTAWLDPQAALQVYEVLKQQASKGTLVVVAEQSADRLARYCDEIVLLEQGQMLYHGGVRAFFTSPWPPRRKDEVYRPVVVELAEGAQTRGLWPLEHDLPLEVDEGAQAWRALLESFRPGQEPVHSCLEQGTGCGPQALQEALPQNSRPEGLALEVRDLAFSYPSARSRQGLPDEASVPVLQNLSLEVRPGERLALVGRNGAGKSTLARLLCGLLQPTQGEVRIAGVPLATRSRGAADLVGYVHQDPGMQLFCRTVEEEVAFGPRQLGLRGEALHRMVDEALLWTGTLAHRQRNPRDLGYSQGKMVALAAVLALGSPCLLLDEPTANLDRRELGVLLDVLNRLREEGKTLLVITHDMELCAEHFDRVLWLAEGRLVDDGPPSRVLTTAAQQGGSTGLLAPTVCTVSSRLAQDSEVWAAAVAQQHGIRKQDFLDRLGRLHLGAG